MSAFRALAFEHWLGDPERHEEFIYHRGDLANDKAGDPDLAALARTMLEHSNGRFDTVSRCGHVRGEIIGDRKLELVTRPGRGGRVYVARKL